MLLYDDGTGTISFSNGSDIFVVEKAAIAAGQELGIRLLTYQPSEGARVDVLPANTTFRPTHFGFDTGREYDYVLSPDAYASTAVDGTTPAYAVLYNDKPVAPLSRIEWWDGVTNASMAEVL